MSEARDRLVAEAALLLAPPDLIKSGDVNAAWKVGEDFVTRLEAAPDVPVKCPCCTKMVVLCREHWQLHAPAEKCLQCWDEA